MKKAWVILAIFFFINGCGKDYNGENDKSRSEDSYQWMTGKLIPNEFGLPEGTWSDSTVRECITRCSADKNCFGFSVEKKFGDAWEGGCEGTLCDKKTECHARGTMVQALCGFPLMPRLESLLLMPRATPGLQNGELS